MVEKTIKKVKLRNGSCVTEQEDVLHHIKQYYETLFKSRDDNLETTAFKNFDILGENKYFDIGGPLTVDEVSSTRKRMKSHKTPGIDGITVEFLKVFWLKLKHIVTNALNCCYNKGSLSTSLRQSIITCLPKGTKDRSLLKNWRPISLLCVIYKLASGSIAERLRYTLDSIISNCQTGFIKGRFLSDSTRLIYDILHVTEKNNIPGLLMLIDFEKAFDSLSWKFLYDTLVFFGYSKDFIKWIKLFNNNISAFVLQSGFMSEPISIKRGCRQGDPISSYLFLIGAEILSRLILNNKDVIGIIIDGFEYKVTQFADDTTLLLDGSQHSLQSALNTLEIYGTMSGLKMNKEKTKIIWIGRKRFSKEKLKVSVDMEWGASQFTMLGLDFFTNLNKIPKHNYDKAILKMRTVVKKWNNYYLTPFGKITIIITNILSQCIHLLTVIPRSVEFLKEVKSIIYNFLWSGKPDKINRPTTMLQCSQGGMNMINIFNFEKAIKVSWIKKIIFQTNSQVAFLYA